MAETVEYACAPVGAKKWHWYNVQRDLVEQGGLRNKEIVIDPFSMNAHGCGGKHRGNSFYITWVPDGFLLVTSRDYDQALIDAFAEVIEYKPFARYKEPTGMVTTEWDKVNPDGRYRELQAESKPELTRLE